MMWVESNGCKTSFISQRNINGHLGCLNVCARNDDFDNALLLSTFHDLRISTRKCVEIQMAVGIDKHGRLAKCVNKVGLVTRSRIEDKSNSYEYEYQEDE